MKRKKINVLIAEMIGWLVAFLIFILPFLFVLFNSLKDKKEANKMILSFPSTVHFENYLEVLKNNDYEVVRAFFNSSLITIFAVLILIIGCSMTGYVLQRRKTRVTWFAGKLLVFGLMVPVAVLPTLRLLQSLHIYKTMFSMVMIEAAINIPFTVMLYKGFMDTIPVTMEEAAWIDGCTSGKLFWSIIMPLLKPVTATVVILNAVTIFNDFTNPLYFYPGKEHVTVQLTIYNFIAQFTSSYNYLFADVIIITIPMLIIFLFFNKQIIAGMVSGAVKG